MATSANPTMPRQKSVEPPPAEREPAGHAATFRWLAVWLLLTAAYAAAGLAYRTLAAPTPGVRLEDLAHWGIVPAFQTATLALVARLRRRA